MATMVESPTRLTREDVFAACRQLLAAGESIIIDRVHGILGRGSRTTVHKYVKQFREEYDPAAEQTFEATRVLSDLERNVRERVATEYEPQIEELRQERDGLAQRLGDTEQDLAAAGEQLGATRSELDHSEIEREAALSTLEVRTDELETALRERDAASTEVDRLLRDNQRLSQQLEAFSARMEGLEALVQSIAEQQSNHVDTLRTDLTHNLSAVDQRLKALGPHLDEGLARLESASADQTQQLIEQSTNTAECMTERLETVSEELSSRIEAQPTTAAIAGEVLALVRPEFAALAGLETLLTRVLADQAAFRAALDGATEPLQAQLAGMNQRLDDLLGEDSDD